VIEARARLQHEIKARYLTDPDDESGSRQPDGDANGVSAFTS